MYRVVTDERTQQQLDALSTEALHAWRELRATLEITPWNGRPLNPARPDGVLTWSFGPHGEGLAYYLVLDFDDRVEVLDVQWLG
ncbi:MAG: hypothetical protein ACRDTE_33800 [Pseudonocardiaceae bacterium]